ncbi:MAG: Bax inhibitor-1 family protein [Alphaproteobacteria bacterium]|nr:MAG: Bax inhibitor-1 family protein [Alphaproteobacteria bacterium]
MRNEKIIHTNTGISRYFASIYQNVGLGIMIVASTILFVYSLHNPRMARTAQMLGMFSSIILLIAQGVTFKLNTSQVYMYFFFYNVSLGLLLNPIAYIFTATSIFRALFSASIILIAFSYYGQNTETDLTNLGNMSIKLLVGIICLSFINLLLGSSAIEFVISLVSLLIYPVLIAYDVQNLSKLYYANIDSETKEKLAIIGSISLILSFLRIMIELLHIFGERKK